MASDKILPSAGHVDGWCVVDLVCRGCNPATAVAIMAALGRAMADTAAELVVGGEGGEDKTMGGGGGGIEGWIIIIVVVDLDGGGVKCNGDNNDHR